MLVPAAFLFVVLFVSNINIKIALLASFLLVAGSFYYLQKDSSYRAAVVHVPASGEITGTIVSDPTRGPDAQSFELKTSFGKVLVTTGVKTLYSYGDALTVNGKVMSPQLGGYGAYFVEQNILCT